MPVRCDQPQHLLEPHRLFGRKTYPRLLFYLTVAWLLVSFVEFVAMGHGIRHANSDDVAFDAVNQTGTLWDYCWECGRAQGRFYFLAALGIAVSPFALPTFAICVIRTLLVATNVAIIGWLVARLFKSARLGWATAVLAALLLQVPFGFYGVFSGPQISAGLTLTCFLLVHLLTAPERRIHPAFLGSCAFLTCCLNECFLAALLLGGFSALVWTPGQRREAKGVLAGLLAYGVVYAAYRSAHPPVYTGVLLSYDGLRAIRAVAVYVGSTFPGFELVVNRHGFNPGAFFRTPSEIASVLSGLRVYDVLLALVGAFLAISWLARARPRIATPWLFAVLAAVGVAFVMPSCLTLKYQEWSFMRQYPYFYSMCSWFVLLALAVTVGGLAAARLRKRSAPVRRIAVVVACLGAAVLSLAVSASNHHVASVLSQYPYPLTDAEYQVAAGRR